MKEPLLYEGIMGQALEKFFAGPPVAARLVQEFYIDLCLKHLAS